MKKIFIHPKTHTLILLVTSLVLYSCRSDFSVQECIKEPYFLEITNELKRAYTLEYKESSIRSVCMGDSIFGFQGLEPQWALSRTINVGDSIEITEVPLNAKIAKFPISETLHSEDLSSIQKQLGYTTLMRFKNLKDESKNLNYFMSVMPNSQMLLSEASLSHRPGLIPPKFSGTVMFFDLNGIIKRKHNYKEGSLTHDFKPIFQSADLRAIEVESCTWTVIYGDFYYYGQAGEYRSEEKYSHTGISYTVHCDTRVLYENLANDPNSDTCNGGGGYIGSIKSLDDYWEKRKDVYTVLSDSIVINAIQEVWREITETASDSGRMEKGFYVFYSETQD